MAFDFRIKSCVDTLVTKRQQCRPHNQKGGLLPLLPARWENAPVARPPISSCFSAQLHSQLTSPLPVSVCRQLHRCAPCADTGHLLAVPSSAAFSPCEIKQIIQGRSDLLFWLSLCFGVCSARLCSASKSSIAHAEPGKGNIQLQNTYSSSAPEYGRTSL